MKKLVAFAAVIAAVSFASCGNKSAENTEVAETETEATVEEVVAPAEQATTEETKAFVCMRSAKYICRKHCRLQNFQMREHTSLLECTAQVISLT